MSARPFAAIGRSAISRGAPLLVLGLGALRCADDPLIRRGALATDEQEQVSYECVPAGSVSTRECPGEVPSYAGEIAGIFERHCGACHIDELGAPWPFLSRQDIFDWQSSIRLTLEECLMPPPETDAPLSNGDREKVLTWLACGAPDN